MKKLLLLLLVFPLVSFNFIQEIWWIGHAQLDGIGTNWDIVRIIKAKDSTEAIRKFKNYLVKELGNLPIVKANGPGNFYVVHLSPDKVIK